MLKSAEAGRRRTTQELHFAELCHETWPSEAQKCCTARESACHAALPVAFTRAGLEQAAPPACGSMLLEIHCSGTALVLWKTPDAGSNSKPECSC